MLKTEMSDILNKIVEVKRAELAAALERRPLAVFRADAESRVLTRDFESAIHELIRAGRNAVIAEFQKATPSKSVSRSEC